jgi:cytochrome c oxidase cbb3-type subunit 3
MRIELKGLLIAFVAVLVVLGATFGVSALVRSRQGTTASAQPAPASSAAKPGAPGSGETMAAVAQGHQFYTQSCASCHGADAAGGYGPNLHHEDRSDAQIARVIKNGVKGRMPAFSAKYGDAQTQALVAYIRTLR